MALAPIRRKATTIAVKPETTSGVDAFGGAAPSAAADFLKADITVSFDQQSIPNPELTGTLDSAAGIAGGTKVRLTLTSMLKGSGVGNIEPQWGKLMRLCSFTSQGYAGFTIATASAGTVNTLTAPAAYSAVDQEYRGSVLQLSTNPVVPVTTLITNYTAGRVASLAHTFGTALSNTTQLVFPPQVLYRPSSDPANALSGTVVIYMDGLLWRFTGCAGSWKVDLTSGGIGTIEFTLTGQYQAAVPGTKPGNIIFDAPQPPVFRQGVCRINGALARANKLTVDVSGTLVEPDNPEAGEGFDPSIIVGRATKGTIDPLMSVADTIARMAAFKAGTAQSVAAVLGNQPGNCVGITVPSAQYTAANPQNRNELMAEGLSFDCNGPDASVFLAVF